MKYMLLSGMLIVLLFSAAAAFAQDWPQWRGAGRDGKVTGVTVTQLPAALTKGWQATVGAGDASPVLVGDRLYLFTRQDADEVTLCLSAADGKELWRDRYAAKPVTGPAGREHQGPRSTPAVATGKIVTLGATGVLSCLDAGTGKVAWRKEEYTDVPRFFTASSPLIVDGLAIAQLGGSTTGGVFAAFDLGTGEVKWKWDGEAPGYASPVAATIAGTKQLVALTEKSVVGLALADGKLLWQAPFPAQGMAYNAATPIVDGDTVYYTGQNRGTHAVKIETGDGGYAVRELWSNPDIGVQFNSPVLKDGLLFGLTDKGFLFCVDAGTGKTDWLDTTKRGGGYAAMLDLGQALVALPTSSTLLAFKPDAGAYAELASFKVADKATYACPIVSGKRLFVKDLDTVTLWTME